MTVRPATTSTQHDITPMDIDQGVAELSKLVGSDVPVEEEIVEEASEELEVEAEAEAQEDDQEDESESSADDEVTDESDAHSDEDEGSETDEAETVDTVTLADGTEIPLEEVQRGYLRQADYTKKTTALAEEKRLAGETITATTKRLETLVVDLEQQATQEPDWNALIDEYGADQVMKSQMAWNEQKTARQEAVTAVQNQREQLQREAVAKARGELMTGTYEPSWTDPKKLEDGLQTVASYAESTYGIPVSDLSNNADPNVFVILDKARKYDALQSKAPQVKKAMAKKPKPTKAGTSSTVKVKPAKDAFARARKTGTDEDAMAALRSMRRAS